MAVTPRPLLEPDLPPVDYPLPDFRPGEDLWVFGYGSLMWRPGFDHLGIEPALLRGYHRAFCVRSVVHRGTRARPGLVLGLDNGGACRGRAIRVAAPDREYVVDYLYRREMVTSVYRPRIVRVRLTARDETVPALAFVVDRRHEQYCGKLALDEAAAVIAAASGRGGPNVEYLRSTITHLDELGIAEGPLHRILALAETAKG
ncbi:gamma-glutamylcyclotransferase [Oceanibacterium hippocampi]|uniref:glutathione-specific gamma-glutamylcyclotransferase n=1 Tax=Oceanibacterium hippocampi TaxID=745714 RepID=A0A1Y5RVJ1_9PROT|nr:gamma-glutamylcyclotransferase [Oceanibacterium hippocampi]SLN26404.1 ChaC-like protein [Oceanibacterium hippocampi]